MSDAYEIREARLSDLPALVRHRELLFEEMAVGDVAGRARMAESCRAYLASALQDGSFRAWLATLPDGTVVGGAALILSPWPGNPLNPLCRRADVLNVYVDPGHRRRGLGLRLMEAVLGFCRAHGLGRVSLHASQQGRPLYERLGFKPTNEMRLEFH